VRTIIAGVAAAPDAVDPEAWLTLIDPVGHQDLRQQLRDLLENFKETGADQETEAGRRLDALREQLKAMKLDGFVVPRTDAHQNEFVAAHSERLSWLTGFTGSAGMAIVLEDRAALFVDGRYTVQALKEVDPAKIEVRHFQDAPMDAWLHDHAPEEGRIGFDPWLHTAGQVEMLSAACEKRGCRAIAVGANPIDRIWTNQPAEPISPIVPHFNNLAGEDSADKRDRIAETLRQSRHDAVVLSAPDSIAWLLNVRGGDIPYAPLPLCFAIADANAVVHVFVDRRKLTPGLSDHFGPGVTVHPPSDLWHVLQLLGSEKKVIRIDRDKTPYSIVRRLRRAGARVVDDIDPCALPKAVKNDVEIKGIRAAHLRDATALCRFLAWLDRTALARPLNEMEAADHLAALRANVDGQRGLSFPTISAAGPNGAVVHYRATPATNKTLEAGDLYLVDSGGQYLDGTTDVTRTVPIGEPSETMCERFTAVLKGHIALATARFPKGTSGSQIDAFARRPLWDLGIDFDHGTGHGVGAYLSVHEGPQRISKLPNRVGLEAGMVISNEPGYYRPGAFGIRTENLVLVVPSDSGGRDEHPMFEFETLTLAPIDRRLIFADMLSKADIEWLDAYHLRVNQEVSPLVDAETAEWLARATAPLKR
jgi:Xaa-Pro aminopeptidase